MDTIRWPPWKSTGRFVLRLSHPGGSAREAAAHGEGSEHPLAEQYRIRDLEGTVRIVHEVHRSARAREILGRFHYGPPRRQWKVRRGTRLAPGANRLVDHHIRRLQCIGAGRCEKTYQG